ncbi:unnamed protein product, partial [marine sediment metagenome]
MAGLSESTKNQAIRLTAYCGDTTPDATTGAGSVGVIEKGNMEKPVSVSPI